MLAWASKKINHVEQVRREWDKSLLRTDGELDVAAVTTPQFHPLITETGVS